MHDRPPTGSIPDAPGSYQFYDAEGRVLYVGKAKSLRHRLPNYWQKSAQLGPRTAQMVAQADHVEWVVVDSEVDALILEHSLIQAHLPEVQRPPQGRQELPVARRHAQRGVAAPGRGPRAQAQGRPLLRPLRQRRRHPQHARPPRQELPGAHVLGHQVHAARAPGPPLPALRHRPLLGPVRRRGRPRGVRRLRQRPHGVPLGRHRAGAGPAGGRDADRQRGPPIRARRPPA